MPSGTYTIRLANLTDADVIAELLRLMDEYYRPGDILPEKKDYVAMVELAMATKEGTQFILCLCGDTPAAIACYAILRPGRDLKGLLFLKDLFVRAEFRSMGFGREMMSFIADVALSHGLGRIDLAADESNEGARNFYASLGGIVRPAVYFTFPERVLNELATLPFNLDVD